MKRFVFLLAILFVVLPCRLALAQGLKTTTVDGGSVVTDLGYNVTVNKGSTLHRTWVVINDPTCPLQLSGAGISTQYGDKEYNYIPVGSTQGSEPVTAFEIRYLLFDVFGDHLKTLSGSEVTDLAANTPFALKETGSWRAWENEVSELLTVASFVAQVRTASGKIWRYQDRPLSEELNKIRLKASAGALEPSKEK